MRQGVGPQIRDCPLPGPEQKRHGRQGSQRIAGIERSSGPKRGRNLPPCAAGSCCPERLRHEVRDDAHGMEHLRISGPPPLRLDCKIAEGRCRWMLDRMGERTIRVQQGLQAILPAPEYRHRPCTVLCQYLQSSWAERSPSANVRPTIKKLSNMVCGCRSPSSANMTPHLSGRISSDKSFSTRHTQYQPRQTDSLTS